MGGGTLKSLTGTISAGTEVASAAAAAVVVVVVGVVIVVLVMEVAWGGGGGGRESAITLTLPSPTKPPASQMWTSVYQMNVEIGLPRNLSFC